MKKLAALALVLLAPLVHADTPCPVMAYGIKYDLRSLWSMHTGGNIVYLIFQTDKGTFSNHPIITPDISSAIFLQKNLEDRLILCGGKVNVARN